VSNAPGKPVSFSRPKVGYFSNRPRKLSRPRLCEGEPDAIAQVQQESLAARNNISVEDFRQYFSTSGSGAGCGASSHRGIPLKGTKVSNLYKYFKYIFFTNSGNFWVFLIIYLDL